MKLRNLSPTLPLLQTGITECTVYVCTGSPFSYPGELFSTKNFSLLATWLWQEFFEASPLMSRLSSVTILYRQNLNADCFKQCLVSESVSFGPPGPICTDPDSFLDMQ
jgi:hypothetical protein